MFSSKKTVFAGKRNLQPAPFCPILSNESGYSSLRRSSNAAMRRSKQFLGPRPSVR